MSSGPYAPPPPPPPPPAGAPAQSSPAVVEPPSFGGYMARPGELTGAGFGVRFLARLIDTIVHYLIGVAAGVFFGTLLALYAGFTHQALNQLVHSSQSGPFIFVFALLGSVAYQSVCESVHGSS